MSVVGLLSLSSQGHSEYQYFIKKGVGISNMDTHKQMP